MSRPRPNGFAARRLLPLLAGLSVLGPLLDAQAVAPDSLVPAGSRIDDAEARLSHARILSYRRETWAESVAAYERLLRDDPKNPLLLAEQAELHLRLGDLPSARRGFESALALSPADPALRLNLARILAWSDRPADALALLDAVNPETPEVLRARAFALGKLGRHAESIALYSNLVANTPAPSAELLADAGDAQLAASRLPGSLALYERALAADPAFTRAQRSRALVLAWLGRDSEARPLLAAFLAAHPADAEIAATLNQVRARIEGPAAALAEARAASEAAPADMRLRQRWADIEVALGHAVRARELYRPVLASPTLNEEQKLAYARAALSWGDVYTAEKLFRDHLARRPGDTAVRDELGALLASFDRLEEASALYRRWLLAEPASRPARLGLARVLLKEKSYAAAVRETDLLLAAMPGDADALRLRADALFAARRDDEARAAYEKIPGLQGLLGLGHLARRAGEKNPAPYAAALKLAPDQPAARFYAAGPDAVRDEKFIAAVLAADAARAPRLVEWAGLYASSGDFASAVRFLEAAHLADPAYFPAQLQLAEFLAISRDYDRAIEAYALLRAKHPENRQVLLGAARAHAWSRRYQEGVEIYAAMNALAPQDHQPVREAARAAGWDKQRDQSADLYARLWTEPVDRALAARLPALLAGIPEPADGTPLRALADWAASPDYDEEPFVHAEFLETHYAAVREALPADRRAPLDELRLDLLPSFLLQRAFYLENQEKEHAWNRRFREAELACDRLLSAEPGNQEALFDLSQAQAAQGLGQRERATFTRLLELDPNNSLAGRALFRRERRSEPWLRGEYRFWREEGRDELASLQRDRFSLTAQETVRDQYRLRLGVLRDRETPLTRPDTFYATGLNLEGDAVFNPFVSGAAGFTHREFDNAAVGHADTGHAHLWFTPHDTVKVGGGWARREELANEFALFQGVRSDTLWLGLDLAPARRLDIALRAESVRYDDDNAGHVVSLKPSWVWTDHPRVFKTTLNLEHRDSDEANTYVFAGPVLANIIHPYWTPQDYSAASVTFEWYHDLSREFFIGGQEHIYALRLTLGTDSEHNEGVGFEAEWRREFADRWVAEALFQLQRSQLWDGTGLRLALTYRF